MPRASDKVALSTALGVLEIARQLKFLNAKLVKQSAHVDQAVAGFGRGTKSKAGKK